MGFPPGTWESAGNPWEGCAGFSFIEKGLHRSAHKILFGKRCSFGYAVFYGDKESGSAQSEPVRNPRQILFCRRYLLEPGGEVCFFHLKAHFPQAGEDDRTVGIEF